MATLRKVLLDNFADSNSESGLAANLLFRLIAPDDEVETTNYWLTGGEDTLDTAEMLCLTDEFECPLDEAVTVDRDGISLLYENGDVLQIAKLVYTNIET